MKSLKKSLTLAQNKTQNTKSNALKWQNQEPHWKPKPTSVWHLAVTNILRNFRVHNNNACFRRPRQKDRHKFQSKSPLGFPSLPCQLIRQSCWSYVCYKSVALNGRHTTFECLVFLRVMAQGIEICRKYSFRAKQAIKMAICFVSMRLYGQNNANNQTMIKK